MSWQYGELSESVIDEKGNLIADLSERKDNLKHVDGRVLAAAQDMLVILRALTALPGFKSNEPYGKAILAIIAKAERRDEHA